jgi:hypothetical protein
MEAPANNSLAPGNLSFTPPVADTLDVSVATTSASNTALCVLLPAPVLYHHILNRTIADHHVAGYLDERFVRNVLVLYIRVFLAIRARIYGKDRVGPQVNPRSV